MGFNKGSQAISDRTKAAQAARDAARNASRLDYWDLKKDEESGFLRFLTDATGWIEMAQHFAKTKAAPQGTSKWPSAMSAVCRNDVQLADYGIEPDCYICANEIPDLRGEYKPPGMRTWALAVERHMVDGVLRDVMEEYEILNEEGKPTGKKSERPKIVLVNKAWSNFFDPLHTIWTARGSLLDRDIFITRSGEGTGTKFIPIPEDKTPDHMPGTPSWKVYEQEIAEREIDLEKIILEQASDKHFARWFDPAKTVDKEGNVVPVTSEGTVEVFSGGLEQPDQATQDRMAKLKERLAAQKAAATSS